MVSTLLASLPSQIGDELSMKLKLEGYVYALNTPQPCNLVDLETVVLECIAGVPKFYKFAPTAPELGRIVREEHYRKKFEALPTLEPVRLLDVEISNKEANRRDKALDNLRKQLSHDDWVAEQRRIGTLVEA